MSIAYLAYVADVSVIWNAKRRPENGLKANSFHLIKAQKTGLRRCLSFLLKWCLNPVFFWPEKKVRLAI